MLLCGEPEVEELSRPFLAVLAKIGDEGRIAVELRAEIEAVSQLLRHGDHVDVDFLMGLGEAGALLVLTYPFIHRLDKGQLLIERHIAGQLVAPVIDVMLLQLIQQAVLGKGRLGVRPGQQLIQQLIGNMRLFASCHTMSPLFPSD